MIMTTYQKLKKKCEYLEEQLALGRNAYNTLQRQFEDLPSSKRAEYFCESYLAKELVGDSVHPKANDYDSIMKAHYNPRYSADLVVKDSNFRLEIELDVLAESIVGFYLKRNVPVSFVKQLFFEALKKSTND